MHDQDLLTAISVSIIAAAVLALLARSVKQPLILGYILGGALLGPNVGLGVVTDEASIELISEIGLILLLFIIGLELSIPRLLQTGRTIIVSGLLQFPMCVALFWFAAAPIAAATGGAFDRLYLGVTLSLSSTLIVVKLLSDKFEMGTLGGRITLGILIFQDIWAIAFLALQPNLSALRAGPLIGSLAAGAGLVLVAGALSRWVLPRLYRAIAKSPEMVLVTSMAWCFLVRRHRGGAGSLEGDGGPDRGHDHRVVSLRHGGHRATVRGARLLRDALLRGPGTEGARPLGPGDRAGLRGGRCSWCSAASCRSSGSSPASAWTRAPPAWWPSTSRRSASSPWSSSPSARGTGT